MSQENVEIVRRGFMAVLEDDWPTAPATLDPEVDWGESWEEWRLDDIEFRPAADEQVIAVFTMVTKGKGSGIEVKRGDAIVYRLNGDKITRTEYFNDQNKALEAAGLSE